MKFAKRLLVVLGITIAAMAYTGCKKKNTTATAATVPQPDESGQSISDLLYVQGEIDYAVTEIYKFVGNSYTLPGDGNGLCGISVDSSLKSSGKILLNFNNSTSCGGSTRSGYIMLSVGVDPTRSQHWQDTGCVIYAEYNYTVVRSSDQKSMKLTCQQYLTNKLPGTFRQLFLSSQDSVVTNNTDAYIGATFSDGSNVVYNLVRRATYTFANGVLTCRMRGAKSAGTLNDFAGTGQTRDGKAFSCRYTSPIIWNLSCGTPVLLQGQALAYENRSGANFEMDAAFGVNASGNTVTAGQCPYGWKLNWTTDGNGYSKVVSY